MNAGKLRHKITIEQRSTTPNSFGEPANTWTTFLTRWASVEPIIGKEFFSSQQVQAEVTTKIRIRNAPGVLPQMRVIFGSKIYDIQAIMDIEEKGKEVLLMCKEVI
jgi:SPP1 family predicted phage head-tail adaptor